MKSIKLLLLGFIMILVKIGDKKNYKIEKYIENGHLSAEVHYTLTDGSTISITLKAGTSFTIKVCNIASSGLNINSQYIFGKYIVKCGQNDFILPVTSNQTYYTDIVSKNSATYQLNGKIMTQQYVYVLQNIFYNITQTYDITTGWMTKLNITFTYPNGSIYIQRVFTMANSSGGGVPDSKDIQ